MNAASILPLAVLALAACGPDFDPGSRVEKLRVLGVQAEPPEIAPAPASGTPVAPDRAALTSLVLRADFAADPGRETSVVYLACVPTPGDPAPSPARSVASETVPTHRATRFASVPSSVANSAARRVPRNRGYGVRRSPIVCENDAVWPGRTYAARVVTERRPPRASCVLAE